MKAVQGYIHFGPQNDTHVEKNNPANVTKGNGTYGTVAVPAAL